MPSLSKWLITNSLKNKLYQDHCDVKHGTTLFSNGNSLNIADHNSSVGSCVALNNSFSQQNPSVAARESSSVGKRHSSLRALCALLGPPPSASLWGGGVDMPLSGACTIRPVPHFKERARGQCTPPKLRSIQLRADSSVCVCVNVYVCLPWTLSRPLQLSFQTAFDPLVSFVFRLEDG